MAPVINDIRRRTVCNQAKWIEPSLISSVSLSGWLMKTNVFAQLQLPVGNVITFTALISAGCLWQLRYDLLVLAQTTLACSSLPLSCQRVAWWFVGLIADCLHFESISINMKNHFCQGFVICFGVRLVVKCFLSPACLPLCVSGGALYTLLWNIIVNRKVYDKTFTWIDLRSHTTKLNPCFVRVYFLAAG